MKEGKGKGCCKINKGVFTLVTIFMLIALALSVSATKPSITPTTWSQNTKIVVDWTPTGGAPDGDITSVIIRLSSASTANSSTSVLLNRTNGTNENFNTKTNLNETFGLNYTIEDSNDYSVVSIVSFNGSENRSSTQTITVDRSAPLTPSSPSPTGTLTKNSDTFQAVVAGINTTGCTLIFSGNNPGSSVYSMTHTGNNCSLALTGIADATYTYTIRATDNTNTSDSASTQIAMSSNTMSSGQRAYAIIASGGGSALGVNTVQTANGFEIVPEGQPQQQQGGALGIINQPVQQIQNFNYGKETSAPELKKTGIGVVSGAAVGFGVGMIGGPLAFITAPIGAVIGGIIGFIY